MNNRTDLRPIEPADVRPIEPAESAPDSGTNGRAERVTSEIVFAGEPLGNARQDKDVVSALLNNDPRLVSWHTKRQYKSDLQTFDAWRNGRLLTKLLVEQYAAEMQSQGYAPSTINQKLAAIRWYARKLSDIAIDEMSNKELAEQAARVALVEDVKGDRPETGRHINQGELSALMDACTRDESPAGIRDAAIFGLAWATGLRREEIAGITMSDLTNDTGDGLDIGIIGKGGKFRTVYVNDGAYMLLKDWIAVRGDGEGMVFQSVNKGGRVTGGRLSGEALRKMLDKRSEQAELSQAITWHDFRRTFAGNLWGAGIDGVVIQKLMGHASQNQTAKYDRRPEEARRQAVKVLHVPYRGRK